VGWLCALSGWSCCMDLSCDRFLFFLFFFLLREIERLTVPTPFPAAKAGAEKKATRISAFLLLPSLSSFLSPSEHDVIGGSVRRVGVPIV